uniref:Transcription factor MYB98 n=1 Tax=Cajanus cajan TaxID=3821 RepID=A0A151TDX9_CAJCA|nr:Transcription factor MYB98 [Cajanus cajan]
MEFDPCFQGSQQLQNPCFKPQPQTTYPSQNSILIPPSPLPILFQPHNTFHHFQEQTMTMSSHSIASMKEGPSSTNIPIPLYGKMPSLSLSDGSLLRGSFANIHRKVIWDFSQKTMVHPFEGSSSNSPSPLFNEYELVMSDYHWDTDQRKKNVKGKKDTNNNNIIKGQWTPEEDSALMELVNQFGPKKWSQIAKSLSSRIGKQCRERWLNHLQPNIKKDSWTAEEDLILIEAHQEFGNKWSEIAKRLPGRSENTVKNHWNTTKRSRNCKRHKKNKNVTYEASLLHTYVKRVTATEEASERLKKTPSQKNKVMTCNCDELALLLSCDNFSHAVFNGNYVPMQVNNNDGGGGNIGYGAMAKDLNHLMVEREMNIGHV